MKGIRALLRKLRSVSYAPVVSYDRGMAKNGDHIPQAERPKLREPEDGPMALMTGKNPKRAGEATVAMDADDPRWNRPAEKDDA